MAWTRPLRGAMVLATVVAVFGALLGGVARPASTGPVTAAEPALITGADVHPAASDPAGAVRIAAANAWVDAGTVPGAGTRWEEMSRTALIDFYYLMARSPSAVPPAGAGDRWDYFWPRDGAFVAVALQRTGHDVEARRVVSFLTALSFDDRAGFEARYQLNGQRVTDRPRGPQSDGCGWVLWMLSELTPGPDPGAQQDFARLREQCTEHLLDLTNEGLTLPPPSPDYWEVSVGQLSLGTAAPIVVGLDASARDYERLGDAAQARRGRGGPEARQRGWRPWSIGGSPRPTSGLATRAGSMPRSAS